MKPLYCITAINKMTREREPVSGKTTSLNLLKEMRTKFLQSPSGKCMHIYPRISNVEGTIFK